MWRCAFLSIGLILSGCSSRPDSPIWSEGVTLSRSVAVRVPTTTTSTITRTASSQPFIAVASTSAALAPHRDGVEECARTFVEALLSGDPEAVLARVESSAVDVVRPWIAAPLDGEVVDVVVLASAAGRARVGVGVAFQPAADGTITEPIAFVVDVVETAVGCRVTALGYA